MSIMMTAEFHYALDAIRAGKNVLISGKPGSGKSTLLSLYLEHLDPSTNAGADFVPTVMVTAPTNVAAHRVHGYTIHKVFGFRPNMGPEDVAPGGAWNPSQAVQDTLRAIDVLVVDEISMVRADHFDMMDRALRLVRENKQPFGGVQLVLVGDELQLPPVVRANERERFLERWATPYFFSAVVYPALQLERITLSKVWRHTDATFVEILNQMREGSAGPRVLAALNTLVDHDAGDTGEWVTLSSYSRRVNKINKQQLKKLEGQLLVSRAHYEGNARENSFNGVEELRYGRGMRVRVLIDDPEGRFYNGSFGTVTHATQTTITVRLDHSEETVEFQRHRWEVTRPAVKDGRLCAESTGSVTQFPLVAGWAMTVYQAQGTTIPRCVIDVHENMGTNGQLYAALSRAVDMEHLRFSSPLTPQHMQASNAVMRRVRRDISPRINPERLVFIAFDGVSLGITDRIARMHVVIAKKGKIVADFGSWINPNCDLGEFGSRMNVPPRGLALAPDLSDFWPLLLRQAAGGLVVGDRLAVLERVIRHQERGLAVNLGVGYDCADLGITLEKTSLRDRCLEMYEHHKRKGMAIERGVLVPPANPHTEGAVYQPVWAEQQPMKLDQDHATDSDNAWASCFGGTTKAKDAKEVVETAELLSAWAISRGVWDYALRREVLDRTRPNTRAKIELPEVDPRTVDLDSVLVPGTRVAFSGCGYNSEDERTDSDFEKLCTAHDLEHRWGVSRKKCDVLIVGDPSSTSRKAKRAREFGLPIIDLAAFDSWCDNTTQAPSEATGADVPTQKEAENETSAHEPAWDGDWDEEESNWDEEWDAAALSEMAAAETEPATSAADANTGDDPATRSENAGEAATPDTPRQRVLSPQEAAELLDSGARVAFRGSTYVHGELRPHGAVLDELCLLLGLEYKQAVSKTRCDALVSDDLDSDDGKNSLALRYGTPLILARDFTAWAEKKLDDEPELIDNVEDLDDDTFLDALARGELVHSWEDSAPEFTYATAAWDFAPAWDALSEAEDAPEEETTHGQGTHFRAEPETPWGSEEALREDPASADWTAENAMSEGSRSERMDLGGVASSSSMRSSFNSATSLSGEQTSDSDNDDAMDGNHGGADTPEGKEPFAAMLARLQTENNPSDSTPRSRSRRAVSDEEYESHQPAEAEGDDSQWTAEPFADTLRMQPDTHPTEDSDDDDSDWDEWEDDAATPDTEDNGEVGDADADEDADRNEWNAGGFNKDDDNDDGDDAVVEGKEKKKEAPEKDGDDEPYEKKPAQAHAAAISEEQQRAAEPNETTLQRRQRKHKSALKRMWATLKWGIAIMIIGVTAAAFEWTRVQDIAAGILMLLILLFALFTLQWIIRLCALGAAKLSADDSTEEATSPPAEKDNSQGQWESGGA
ncbi:MULTISPECIES: AAA family ATPase [Corynebacterium]|uniref:AAA family ATPase n=1 Tax=Corynebacterium TaxID=1716 RepID=UPI00124BE23D|nr:MULTISPECIES: AAA family ATPase [Corynebacterium]